jgi:proton glutamate symport protein
MNSESSAKRPGLALHWKVLIALGLGVAAGVLLNEYWTAETWSRFGVGDAKAFAAGKASAANEGAGLAASALLFVKMLNEFVGNLFLRGLRFIAMPIVFFSIVGAIAGIGDVKKVGRIGTKTVLWFLFTMAVSVAIAMVIVLSVKPGTFVSEATRDLLTAQNAETAAARVRAAGEVQQGGGIAYFFNYLLDVVPANPFGALSQGVIMQVIASAMLLGIGLSLIAREKAAPVLRLCEGIAEGVMALVGIIMALAPFAVFCLTVRFIADLGVGALWSTLAFCLCVVGGLGLILFVLQPMMLYAVTPAGNKIGLRRFLRGMAPAITLAFSSSSSSATLPVTIRCTRDGLGVPDDLASFVCPLGSTLNMDGTALYQVVSVLFLAQLYQVDLTVAQHATVGLMAIVVAIGSPGLPGASVVMMAVVLEAVGVPTAGIGIILAVDRLLDMCRTIVNVSGDAVCAVAVASSEGRLGKGSEVAV